MFNEVSSPHWRDNLIFPQKQTRSLMLIVVSSYPLKQADGRKLWAHFFANSYRILRTLCLSLKKGRRSKSSIVKHFLNFLRGGACHMKQKQLCSAIRTFFVAQPHNIVLLLVYVLTKLYVYEIKIIGRNLNFRKHCILASNSANGRLRPPHPSRLALWKRVL